MNNSQFVLEPFRQCYRGIRLRLRYPHVRFGSRCSIFRSTLHQNVWIGDNVTIRESAIGRRSFIRDYTEINNASIGRFCSIAPNVCIGTGSHPVSEFVSTHPLFYTSRPAAGWDFVTTSKFTEMKPSVVGNDVWIGRGAIIRDGLHVADGAVIGAGAVVTHDVAAYEVIAGVPARHIRFRFSNNVIKQLLDAKWWEKDDQWLRKHASLFDSVDRYLASTVVT